MNAYYDTATWHCGTAARHCTTAQHCTTTLSLLITYAWQSSADCSKLLLSTSVHNSLYDYNNKKITLIYGTATANTRGLLLALGAATSTRGLLLTLGAATSTIYRGLLLTLGAATNTRARY